MNAQLSRWMDGLAGAGSFDGTNRSVGSSSVSVTDTAVHIEVHDFHFPAALENSVFIHWAGSSVARAFLLSVLLTGHGHAGR